MCKNAFKNKKTFKNLKLSFSFNNFVYFFLIFGIFFSMRQTEITANSSMTPFILSQCKNKLIQR